MCPEHQRHCSFVKKESFQCFLPSSGLEWTTHTVTVTLWSFFFYAGSWVHVVALFFCLKLSFNIFCCMGLLVINYLFQLLQNVTVFLLLQFLLNLGNISSNKFCLPPCLLDHLYHYSLMYCLLSFLKILHLCSVSFWIFSIAMSLGSVIFSYSISNLICC